MKNLQNQGKAPQNSNKNSKKFNQEPKIGALNSNGVLCTDQAPLPAFCALYPGSALNPRAPNPGTIHSPGKAKALQGLLYSYT